MKPKKNPRFSLERQRFIFFETGIVLALAFVLFAFEWSSHSKKLEEIDMFFSNDFLHQEEIIISTRPKEEIKSKSPEIKSIINLVPDDVKVDEAEFWDPESRGNETFQLWDRFESIEEESFENEPKDFVTVEEKPLFNGGNPMETFGKYVASKINYPVEAIENGVQGRVTVRFIIDAEGFVTNIEVIDSPHPILTKEAVRVISSSPRWTPGKQRSKPVAVNFYFPVIFRLN